MKHLHPRTWLLLCLVGLGFGAIAVMAVAGWLALASLNGNGDAAAEAGRALLSYGPWAAAAVLALCATAWFVIDRHLIFHEHDHRRIPARPEFYDFDLYDQPMHLEEVEGRPLKSLSYIVLDTETTGLRPSGGNGIIPDEMLSIGGVRLSHGEILHDVTFSRLINPGRSIPKASIRFHGITDDMVRDEPAAAEVVAQFKEFAGDAVLVAHNAAFDMKFLKLKEAAAGVVFDNVVLDTLLLSVFLDNQTRDHTLDAICQRCGVEVEGRHTALGDSLATAEVFLRLLKRLEDRGITTLYQAVAASNKMVHIRRQQEKF